MSIPYSVTRRNRFTAQNFPLANGVPTTVFWLIFGACAAIPTVGPNVLQLLGIQYATSGGSTWEKLHPSSYLILLGFGLWAYEVSKRRKLFGMLTAQHAAFALLSSSLLLMVYDAVMIGEQYAIIIDSFLVPALLLYVVREISNYQKLVLAVCVHVLFIVNSTIGIYEFVTGTAIIVAPLADYVNVGTEIDISDWELLRSSALWGHPLTATLATVLYLLANFIMPANAPFPLLRGTGIAVSLMVLPAFGGRFSILLFILLSAFLGLRWLLITLVNSRAPLVDLSLVLAGAFFVAALVTIGNEAGYFDKFIDRLSDDNGSASTRSTAGDLLLNSDALELLLGDINHNLTTRMVSAGTIYGVEIFWIAFILRYGLLISLAVFPGLLCFIVQAGRDLGFAGVFVSTFFILSQSGCVGLTAKTTIFSGTVLICYVLLPGRQVASRPDLTTKRAPENA